MASAPSHALSVGTGSATSAASDSRGPRAGCVTDQPVRSTRSAGQPPGALAASTPIRFSTDDPRVGRDVQVALRIDRRQDERDARIAGLHRQVGREEVEPEAGGRAPRRADADEVGGDGHRAEREAGFGAAAGAELRRQVDRERELRVPAGQVDRGELDAQVGEHERASAGQVVDAQRARRADEQAAAVEPGVELEAGDDRDRPRVVERAGALDGLRQLRPAPRSGCAGGRGRPGRRRRGW